MPWLILFSLCLAIFSANSKAQEQSIEQLLTIEIAAYQVSSAFSAYVLFAGSPKFSQQLESALETTGPILTKTNTTYPKITEKLQESLGFIERNKELVFEADDHRLIIGLSTSQNQLYQLINDKKQSTAQHSPKAPVLSPVLDEYLNVSVSFERVVALYMAISASSAGFVSSDTTIEENVIAFTASIESITNKDADFQRLNVKWKFIKGNMIKDPGQTSPFITLHTAGDMREILQRMYQVKLVTVSSLNQQY
jgi:hypothetical protein